MTRLQLKHISLIICLAAVLSCPAQLLAADQPDFFGSVPADALFCVRINNLDASVAALDQYLAGVAPVPPLGMMVRAQLGEALGDPNLPGVNMTGSFGFFGIVKDAQSEPMVFLVFPISDMKAFSACHSVGKPDPNGITPVTSKTIGEVAMLARGNYVIVCPMEEYANLLALAKMAKPAANLLDGLTPLEKTASTTAPLWARVNMARINSLYGDAMEKAFDKLKNMPNPMMGNDSSSNKAFLNAYFDSIYSLAKQTQAVNIVLAPKADALTLSLILIATPGSEMATTLSLGPTPKGSPELMAYMEDGALANCYIKVNRPLLKKLYISFFDLLAKTNTGTSQPDMEKAKALIIKCIDACGDTTVGTMKGLPGGKPAFSFNYAIQIKDAKVMKDCIKEATDMMNKGAFADMYASMGLKVSSTYTPDSMKYNGASIDSWTMSMKTADPNSQEAKMMTAMYGDGMKGLIAFTDGLALCYAGPDAEATIKKMIDERKAGGPKTGSAEFKSAMAMVPDAAGADLICTYNYLRIFKALPAMLPIPGLAEAFAKLPESKSNLIFSARAANGALSVDIILPKLHAQELMGAFMQMQASAKQQQQNNNGESRPMKKKSKMPD
jgi:hypothetical protein